MLGRKGEPKMQLNPWFTKAELYFYNIFSTWMGEFDCLSFIACLSKKYGDDNVIDAIKEHEWLIESITPLKFHEAEMNGLLVHIRLTLQEKYGWLFVNERAD